MRHRKWWIGTWVALTLVLVLCAVALAAAEDAPIQIGIQEVQTGHHVTVSFSFESGAFSQFTAGLRVKGTEKDLDRRWFYPGSESTSESWTFDYGYYLQPGNYTVNVQYWDSEEQTDKNLNKDFTIAASTQPSKPVLSADNPTVYYYQSTFFSLGNYESYNLTAAYQYVKKGEGWDEAQVLTTGCNGNGAYLYIYDSSNDPGTYEYQIRVSVNEWGVWSPWSDPYDVNYIYHGDLPEPVITIASGKKVGQDIPFSFVCENAEGFEPQLYKIVGENEEFIDYLYNEEGSTEWEGTSGTVNYPLTEAGNYSLHICASAPGYNTAYASAAFTVGEGSLAAGPQVTLNEGGNIYAYSHIPLRASMSGLDKIYFEKFSAGGNRSNYIIYYADEIGEVSASVYSDDVGEYTLKVWGHANGKWTKAVEIPYTVQEKPTLPEPAVTLSKETLQAGEELTIAFADDARVSYYSYSVYRKDAQDNSTFIISDTVYPYDQLVKTVKGYNLLEAGTYEIQVYSYPRDYNAYYSSNITKNITVTGTGLSKLSITLPSQDKYYRSQEITVSFDQTYDEYRLRADKENDTYEYWEGANADSIIIDISDIGEFTLTGTAKKNGRWTQWSDPVQLKIESRGKLNDGSIALDSPSTTLQAGTDITGTVQVDSRATHAYLEVYRLIEGTEDQWAYFTDQYLGSKDTKFSLSGASFLAGTYELRLDSYGDGYDRGETKKRFTVTGTLPAGPKAVVPTQTYIDQETEFSLTLSGATELNIRYYMNAENNPGVNSYNDSNKVSGENTFTWSHSFWSQGTWGIRISAKKDGRWTAWGEMVTIKVISKGNLTKPGLTLPAGEITAGVDLEVTYTPDSHAEYGYMYLYQLTGDSSIQLFSQYIYNFSGSFTVGGHLLSPGQYRLEMSVNASGYGAAYETKVFIVTGQETEGPVITLDKASYQCGEMVLVTLDKTYDAVCAASGSEARLYFGRSSFRWNTRNYQGSMTLRVKTQTNGIWSQWTSKEIRLTGNGALKEPEITVVKAVTGEDVQVQIENLENADRYQVLLYDSKDMNLRSFYLDEGGLLTIDESLFSAGQYRLRVYAYGVGYYSAYTEKSFTVTGTRTGTVPTAIASATTVYDNSPVTFVVSAPGADQIRVKRSTYLDTTYYTVKEGKAKLLFEYVDDGENFIFAAQTNGIWSEWSEPITITVKTSDKGYSTTLNNPVLTLSPTKWTVGNDLKVSMSFDSRATSYDLKLRYEKYDEWAEEPFIADGSLSSGSKAEITIPGTVLSRSGSYILEVWANGENVNSGYARQKISVTGQTIYKPAPTVVWEGITEGSIGVGEMISMTVSAGEGTISEIRVTYTQGGWNSESVFHWGNMEPNQTQQGSISLGEYLTGQTLNLELSAKIDGIWSATADCIVRVREKPALVKYPVPTLDKDSVTMGETIRVAWPKQDSSIVSGLWVDWYHVPESDTWYNSELLTADMTSYSIDTANLESGTYYVYIYPEAKAGYRVDGYSRIYAAFHVKEPATGNLRTLTLPAAVKTVEEEAFAGTNAQKIVLPSGCTAIGSRAFAFSDNLSVVVIPASVTSIAEDAFLGCEDVTIETTKNSAAASFGSAHGIAVTLK